MCFDLKVSWVGESFVELLMRGWKTQGHRSDPNLKLEDSELVQPISKRNIEQK